MKTIKQETDGPITRRFVEDGAGLFIVAQSANYPEHATVISLGPVVVANVPQCTADIQFHRNESGWHRERCLSDKILNERGTSVKDEVVIDAIVAECARIVAGTLL